MGASPMRTRIKVCGMTDAGEVAGAVAAGVDAVGFIFAAKSPRSVTPETARAIIEGLPPFVDAVGVFVNTPIAQVNDIARHCRLTLVQLHGDESPDDCALACVRAVKAFRVGADAPGPDFTPYAGRVAGILLDTYVPHQAGGTGLAFDWGLVGQFDLPAPLILAGGLTPDNVVAAIQTVRPYAVDVNSGVEISPGRKDLDRLRRFIRLVRSHDPV